MRTTTRTTRSRLAALTGLALALPALGVAGLAHPAAAGTGASADDAADDAAVVVATGVDGAPAAPSGHRSAATNQGSLVFIRDHDVWISRPDGTGARAVTTDGTVRSAYGSPTQATNGTIAAQRGQRIVRLDPAGRKLGEIDPKPVPNGLGHLIDGVPVWVAISPDASRIAYTFTSFECDSVAGCHQRYATGVTRADRASDPVGESTRDAPKWLTGNRLLLGGGGGINVYLQDIGQEERYWFADSDTGGGGFDFEDLAQPTVSADGTLLAAVRGYDDDTHIFWYDLSQDPRTTADPATPSRKCTTNRLDSFASPTFSPGGWLALEAERDVYATNDPGDCAHQIQKILENAQQPSYSAWGYRVPAPVNTAKPTIAGTAKVGKRLTARTGTWTPRPTSYRYQWLRNGKAIRGATRATYTATRVDRGRRLAVRVTARGAGGTRSAVSAARTVAR